MADTTADPADGEAPKKASKLPLIIGIVLALAGGGGGFFAVSSGMLNGLLGIAPAESAQDDQAEANPPPPIGDIAFIELEPLVISLTQPSAAKFLKFRATLEVKAPHQSEVESILPRIQDVMNTYLRALTTSEIEEQGALLRIRGQLLRRIKIVTGEGRVNDLLVMEFVLD